MQLSSKFITWRLFVAEHVSGAIPPIIRAKFCPTTTNNVTSFNLQRMQNQRLRVQLYAPDDRRYDARNMLSHK